MKKLFYFLLFILVSILTFILVSGKISDDRLQAYVHSPTVLKNKTTKAPPNITEVYVLGTMHTESPNILKDSLYLILEKIQADVILVEIDSVKFPRTYSIKNSNHPTKLRYLFRNQNEVERPTALKYLHHNPNTKMHPYEWIERDAFHQKHQIQSKPSEVLQHIKALEAADSLQEKHRKILAQYLNDSKELNKIANQTLSVINTTKTDSICEQRQIGRYQKIKQIVDETPALNTYKSFVAINKNYWDIRNKAMANNIKHYIQKYPKKRIVVLNGFFHRYYLIKELQQKEKQLNYQVMPIPF